ncbi:MAG: DUF5717 family protein [Clostridiales bacterium]|nr:DUF5717 family protein [Clostridiales bacterium]
MKEKILSLARGEFRYESPKLRLSNENLIMQVEEGAEASVELTISNDEDTKVKGFGASEDIHFDFFPVFDGKKNVLQVKVKAGNRKAGENIKGELVLVTDCGECRIPYEVQVVKSYLKDSQGNKIVGLDSFLEYARENLEEAVSIFYHEKFRDLYLENMSDKRLYQHLTNKNSKKQALIEFLISHGRLTADSLSTETESMQMQKKDKEAVRENLSEEEKIEKRNRKNQKMKWRNLIISHIQYIMNSSRKEQWLQAVGDYFHMDCILEGYLGFVKKDEEEMQKYLGMVEGMAAPEEGATLAEVLRYLTSQYIKCKINKNELDKDEFYAQVCHYQANGYQHIFCTVMLERMGYYQENMMGLWEALNQLWKEGCYSPYLYLYQAMILLQEPDLLVGLDSQIVGVCRFALKYDLLTENEVLAISFLAAKKKKDSPAVLALLMGCYNKFHTLDTLHSICALLIRGEKQGPQYLNWYELGVKKHLRLTELYEYYMYSLPPEEFDNLNPAVYSYFQYENHLRDSVKTLFFRQIVQNKEKHPEDYAAYEATIKKYVFEQAQKGKIDAPLGWLYDYFLPKEPEIGKLYQILPEIIFSCRITCLSHESISRVVVVHDEGGGEQSYRMHGKEAIVSLATPNYQIYFVDENGYYRCQTIEYKMEKLCHLDSLAEMCYDYGADSTMLKLHLFSEILSRDTQIGTKEAILIHELIRSRILGVEYEHKGLLALYDYYKSIGEDALLEEVIRDIDFHYISRERQVGILQTMIQYQMNEDALGVFRKYELTESTPKLILLLITWVLGEKEQKFDPYYMRLCNFLYEKGEKNKDTIGYLLDYYMGDTMKLLEFYNVAGKLGLEVSDGALERLLGQALFSGADLTQFLEPFEEYYEYGANRTLVKAFLSEVSYEYLTERMEWTTEWKNMVAKECLATRNSVMVLALLKYFSTRDTLGENEREWAEFQLEECVAQGKYFAFMKDFCGKIKVPFEIENATILNWIGRGNGKIFVEIGEEKLVPMHQILPDVYSFVTIMFYHEKYTYRILDEQKNPQGKEGVLSGTRDCSQKEPAFYTMLQEMLSLEQEDEERVAQLMKEYQERKRGAQKLLQPLEWEGEKK